MTPVAIAGMHRSGTSMVAQALRRAGLYLGEETDFVPPAPDNPEGFFEHTGFVGLNDDLLEATAGAWDHPPVCGPIAADDQRVAHLRGPAMAMIERLSLVPAWGWKDPRSSLTARFWLDLLDDLRFLICVRHPLEVALSLKRRNNTSYAHALSLWHAYYEAVLDAVPRERRLLTHFDSYFRDTAQEVARLTVVAGLQRLDDGEAAIVRPELRHHHVDIRLVDAGIDEETIRLYQRLCAEADYVDDRDDSSSGRVDRGALDLVTANHHLALRGRQVTSLERERSELAERVADLEAIGREEVLGEITARLDGLESAFHDLRYLADELGGRRDAPVVRGCRSLVRAHVPRHDEVLVVAKGDAALLDLYGRPSINFPSDDSGNYPGFAFNHSIAAIAHLEARRLRHSRFLLIPETAAWWTEHFPGFTSHLLECYEVVADEPGIGVLVDLRARRVRGQSQPRSVLEAVDRLAAVIGHEPSVLDWTGRRLAGQLPRRNVFEPPAGDKLPYLDDTIDMVLVDSVHRCAEARRVAAGEVVTVTDGRGPTVANIELMIDAPASSEVPIRFVVRNGEPDPAWLARLEECLADEQSVEIVLEAARARDLAAEAGVIAVIEDGVLPLPGCCEATRRTLACRSGVGAVAVKLFSRDGSLEAAGTTVFADGSWASIGAGTHEVVAPWHDYVREVSGGLGLVFFDAGALAKIGGGGELASMDHPVAWTAPIWNAGLRVLYQPDAMAVRAVGESSSNALASALVAKAWATSRLPRPSRPDLADDRAWWALLAGDDMELSRG